MSVNQNIRVSLFRYVVRGIWYYKRINLVVLLAVAISTAVIAGSLIVGDSVRHSLRKMTEERLGRITHVLNAPTFFRQELCSELQSEKDSKADYEQVEVFAPAILVTGSVEAQTKNDQGGLRRAGSVTIVGLDDSGWQLLENGGIAAPADREVVLGFRTAQELQVKVGGEVSVWVEVPTSIPRDSLLGERDDVNVELVLSVAAIIPEDVGASRFDLNPGQQLPYNAFLPLATLQSRLGLEAVEANRRTPVAKLAKINAVLVGGLDSANSQSTKATTAESMTAESIAADMQRLQDNLKTHIQLTDVGLRLRPIVDRGYISVESERMILEDSLATSTMQAAKDMGYATAPALVYLANEIYATERATDSERYSMYSIIAGIPLDSPAPLGPLTLMDGTHPAELAGDEILLSAWLAEDLKVNAGDSVSSKWHEVGSHAELPEIEKTFVVKGILSADDPVTVDQNLTPTVEGITDVDSFGEWDQPFDMDMTRITPRDDDYWTAHKATPKAFIALATAEDLWNSRYGKYTSVRIASGAEGTLLSEEQLTTGVERLTFEIQQRLNPAAQGMIFRPVLAQGLKAAVGANDFTQLFVGFSFFLILSAIILASLMFRLGIQTRINQLGLMNAVGWPQATSRRLFLSEGLSVCVAGAIVGAAGGVYFAKLMIYGLTTWWIGAVGTKFLQLQVEPLRLVMAAAVSVTLAMIVILLALRSFRQIGIRDQLSGNSQAAEDLAGRSGWWSRLVNLAGISSIIAAIAVPVAVLADVIPSGVAFEGLTWPMICFFIGGFACLIAGLYVLSLLLRRRSRSATISTSARGLGSLAMANAARSPSRSLLTTALIAFATFVIVAVGAGRRNPLSETPDFSSGNGGFSLVAESAQPVLYDLNTTDGRTRLGFVDDDNSPQLPADVNVFPFSMKPGTDASCVNLYQATVPTLLGASTTFVERGGFRFANSKLPNPWQMLNDKLDDTVLPDPDGSLPDRVVPTIPVIGDANTLQYSLKTRVGGDVFVPDKTNPEFALRVVGMLDGSVFQGVLVMSDLNLKRVDPSVAGSRYFLIETASLQDADTAASVFETRLNDYGLDTELVSERLSGFLAVQNTYLSTFQMLGGLGLLVGTFGLAAVMVRNVVERRREIALMRAVGFTTGRISRLILYENNVLLMWGILLGTGSALLAMSPHLRSTGGDLPWQSLAITLVAVAVIGSLASLFAVRTASTVSIRENLTAE